MVCDVWFEVEISRSADACLPIDRLRESGALQIHFLEKLF